MTNITGKIYQETNDDGTENRFPKTVVPAVIGLSQYLQDQFNTLSDLYMPKEGESESKTGQEIIYRKSEATINAKTVTIDRIYGKTLVWNQINNNISGSEETGGIIYSSNFTRIPNHKYYIAAFVKSSSTGTVKLSWYGTDLTTAEDVSSSFKKISALYYNLGEIATNKFARIITTASELTYYGFIVIDLTLMFGTGNEPSTVEEFESMFPGYHSYEPGKLISNDAESIETVGFNQWDEEWESGYYDNSNGSKGKSSVSLRSKNKIPAQPNTVYYIKSPTGSNVACNVCFFNGDSYLGFSTRINDTFTTPAGCNQIAFTIEHYLDVVSSVYQNDICINLSDPAKNGTYEPYRKSAMQLGLDSIKVKSHNIWDEEWEVGGITANGIEDDTFVDRWRSVGFTHIIGNTSYYVRKTSANYVIYIYEYDVNKAFIRYDTINGNGGGQFVSHNNACYIRLSSGAGYGTTYNNDVCINVSSSFNGQYEPHGDITITGGLKSAGSVKDEIKGNKYIKRVGEVDLGTINWVKNTASIAGYFLCEHFTTFNYMTTNKDECICSKFKGGVWNGQSVTEMKEKTVYLLNKPPYEFNGIYFIDASLDSYTNEQFKTAMQGVMLYYELATPIEYELVEPLVPTVKAGETEERISPNSDGLSAPFCCDLTYNASETAGVLDALQGLSRKLELIEERLARLEDN